jgi:hypothetical protein
MHLHFRLYYALSRFESCSKALIVYIFPGKSVGDIAVVNKIDVLLGAVVDNVDIVCVEAIKVQGVAAETCVQILDLCTQFKKLSLTIFDFHANEIAV